MMRSSHRLAFLGVLLLTVCWLRTLAEDVDEEEDQDAEEEAAARRSLEMEEHWRKHQRSIKCDFCKLIIKHNIQFMAGEYSADKINDRIDGVCEDEAFFDAYRLEQLPKMMGYGWREEENKTSEEGFGKYKRTPEKSKGVRYMKEICEEEVLGRSGVIQRFLRNVLKTRKKQEVSKGERSVWAKEVCHKIGACSEKQRGNDEL
eukprot:gnl/TRDRNA2_/TRDRNA2_47107_c0_seq2.p1 gnl/TRDRNA2_/TRDRNA2_47107_c0~~gnl/TRDRNA2_/TRDRNA2_47107_c0_seq2.p1  ORF type:complete len:203 (-),score=44.63 gnl/TRDRNA2_/TRDRNA2_47107_c0_seq2:146-754(-)